MPGTDGLSLLRQVKAADRSVEVIVMTAYGTVDTAVEAMREGAYDYIEKPINQERLPILIDRILEKQALAEDNLRLREAVKMQEEFGGLIGKAENMAKVYQFIEMVAPTGATVLIQGESGVGKELIARAIHQRSPRSQGPLVSMNCGAIPESLLESELFGFEKGAFTGADTARQGKIEMSDRGTLFLDEVGEMNPKTQIELLRVLETKELRRLGGSKLISVDLRILAATNKKLSDEVAAGRFREDLFYRLNVVPVVVPSLRERREDIPMLTERFLREFASTYQRPRKRLSREVAEFLMGLCWPGNVRELRNLMERLTCRRSIALADYPSARWRSLSASRWRKSRRLSFERRSTKLRLIGKKPLGFSESAQGRCTTSCAATESVRRIPPRLLLEIHSRHGALAIQTENVQ
jgi:DNA-binding NtrC family response regulator